MSDNSCQNCSVVYGPDDMFCENCGYDFITGSLPVDAAMAPSSGGVAPAPGAPPAPSSGAPSAAGAPTSGAPDAAKGSGAESPAAPSVLSAAGSTEAGGGNPDASASGEASESAAAGNSGSAGSPLDVPRITIAVSVDREYFDAVVNDGEIDFPDPVPSDQELELAGSELHIGRTSESRAIHPDIDVAALTEDQAVSSRHAVLRVANDGSYTLVDVGSTNGTFVESVDSEAITHGVPIEIKPGQALYVGAWTKLTILS